MTTDEGVYGRHLGAEIARLADLHALGRLVEGYLASLDRDVFDEDWARSFFTEDVALTFPVGAHDGRAGVEDFTRAIMDRWESTHHHGSTPLIDLDGDRASVTWSLIASHIHFGSPQPPAASRCFQLGGRFDASVRRTSEGWRFERLRLRITWTAGSAHTEVTSVDAATLNTGDGPHITTQLEGSTP